MARHNETGKLGEQLAEQWLIEQGYVILEKNWKFGKLEIDIIATKNDKLQFLEVKTRRSNTFGYPEELVDRKKLYHFITAGTEYIRINPTLQWIQFNILSITLSENEESKYFLIEDVYL